MNLFQFLWILFPVLVISIADGPIPTDNLAGESKAAANKTAGGPKYKSFGDLDLHNLYLKKANLIMILEQKLNTSIGAAANDTSSKVEKVTKSDALLPSESSGISSNSGSDLGELYKIRIERLNLMEREILSSLELLDQIVSLADTGTLESSIDDMLIKESDLIIEGFQKLVMKAKNDKLLYQDYLSSKKDAQIKEFKEKIVTVAKNTSISKGINLKLEKPFPKNLPPAIGIKGKVDVSQKDPKAISIPVIEESTLENVLKDVAEKADTLESGLKQDKFQEGQQEKGSSIETVVKVGGEGTETSKQLNDKSPSSESKKPVVLIDSANNQYVLSKPGDATAHVEDTVLLQDLLILLLVCCVSGIIMYFIGLPVFFGYIISGTILSKNRLIENAVQVETISRCLGVIFIMFYLGLEFNLAKLGRIWTVSLFGSFLLLIITLLLSCTILPHFVHASLAESFVIGSSVFLSSTAVVIHFLKPGEGETNYGRPIMGILVAQDILLGFLLAIMPGLEQSGGLSEIAYKATRLIILSILFTVASFILRVPILECLAWLLKKSRKSAAINNTHHQSGPSEVFLLTSIGVLLMYLGLGQLFEQSIELSCFVAGVTIAGQKTIAEALLAKLEPFKQIFSALFFASIGLHIYPSFLYNEGVLLITLTLIVMLFKAFITIFVMNIIFRIPAKTSALIGVGLGQISEFTFVLTSKAKSRGVVSREFFFILIGITSMSMFLSPFFWSFSSWTLGMGGSGKTLPVYLSVEESTEEEDNGSGRENDLSLRLFEKRTSLLSDGPGVLSNDSLPSFKSD